MTGLELKQILYNDTDLIVRLLESFGCEYINVNNRVGKITSTRPDGDNRGSVSISISPTLNTKCYTKPEYESLYPILDIITLTQFFMDNCNMNDAVEYILGVCGIDGKLSYEQYKPSETASFLRSFKKNMSTAIMEDFVTHSEGILDEFLQYPIQQYIDDGVDAYTQSIFDVRYDLERNRAVFAIRSKLGDIVDIKGRTLEVEYKEKGIAKFLYYHECDANKLLFGEYENQEYLKSCDEILIFESEKSVMVMYSLGFRNCVATSKKTISRMQLNRLLSYGKPIVICYDKDVLESALKIECMKFKKLIKTYYIYDWLDLLDKKDSPIDKGLSVWEQLYDSCKFEY